MVYEAATPLATDGDPVRLKAYHAAWENSAPFRSRERSITAVFGTALLVEAVLRSVVVFSLAVNEVDKSVLAGSTPGAILIVAALVLMKLQVPTLQRLVDAEQERNVATAATAAELPAARLPAAPLADPKLS